MIAKLLYDIISPAYRHFNEPIALHEPYLRKDDANVVAKVVEDGWVSYQGEMVAKFESALAFYLSVPEVICVDSGTAALFISLETLGIGAGDEVFIPSLTFAATANSVLHTGATPHFIDSDLETLNLDIEKLERYLQSDKFLKEQGRTVNRETGNMVKALVPVHVLGSSCDLDKITAVANKYHLMVIEDSAEALGSNYQNAKVSALSGVGILSFNGNKVITTGGGGAVVTDNKELAHTVRHLSTTAKKPHAYEFIHDRVGYNLRMPALNAALGYSQLQKIDVILKKKRALYLHYCELFNSSPYVKVFCPDSYGTANCWLNALVLNEEYALERDVIIEYFHKRKVFVRPLWKPLHSLAIYGDCPKANCEIAENIYQRTICLPSSPKLVDYA